MGSKAATTPGQDSSDQALAQVDYSKGQLATGMENYMSGQSDFGQSDISIPFLRIIQGLSPWIQPQDPKYDEDAKQGQIVETVTPQFFDGKTGIYVIPVLYQRSYTEWKPNRGGLVADHGSSGDILKNCKRVEDGDGKTKIVTPAGNEISEAALYYVMWATSLDGPWEQALLTMSGTQWRKARDWNTNMAKLRITKADGTVMKNPLPFAGVYHFTTVGEKKDNYNFFGWKIEHVGYTLALNNGLWLVQEAVDFRHLAQEGRVKGADDGITTDEDIDKAFNAGGAGNGTEF